MTTAESQPSLDFVRQIVADDLAANINDGQIVTRFPPEPNGYLHIGHAKSICLNFGIAHEFGGRCHLRFDDTNPTKEEQEYIDAIKRDIRWLGFDWGKHEYYASDYFQQLYDWAELLIKGGRAFVCDLTAEQVREYRGTLTKPGRESPFRQRSIEENLDLFRLMKTGEFSDGARTLRARIDMNSPNLNLRDPVLYRILHAHHPRTGEAWCIYPMYDYAHGQSDWIEGITHSICTLEFADHRPLYDWLIEQIETLGGKPRGINHHPHQYEFARLSLNYTMMSKRKLLELVEEGHVSGWDDPRMPTLSGLRRRGYPPEAIRAFCESIGVTKFKSVTEVALLEHHVREELNKRALRVLGVLDPVKVIITNYPEGKTEELESINNPEDPGAGTRMVPFSRELYIEREDFMENPPPKYFRLSPGREVRLRFAYFITCTDVKKDPRSGEITEIHCTYDPASRGGNSPDGRKVKGTIHWVSVPHAISAEVRLYEQLFTKVDPDDVAEGMDYRANLNPKSLTIKNAKLEPSLADAKPEQRCQFERVGYFFVDPADSAPGKPVFNRIVTLRDSWTGKSQ